MKKPKAPHLVTVAIFTTVTLIFWIFFSLYSVLTGAPEVNIDPTLLDPLDPTLDTTSLNILKDRVFFSENDVAEIALPSIAYPSPTPTETVTEEETVAEEETEETAEPTEIPSETPTPEGEPSP